MLSYINSASFIVSYEKTIMNHKTPEESFQYEDGNKTKSTWNRNYLLDNINHRRTWESNKTIAKKMSNYHLRPFVSLLVLIMHPLNKFLEKGNSNIRNSFGKFKIKSFQQMVLEQMPI